MTITEWLEKSYWWRMYGDGFFLAQRGIWRVVGIDMGPGGDLSIPVTRGYVDGTLKQAIEYALSNFGESFYGWGDAGQFQPISVVKL